MPHPASDPPTAPHPWAVALRNAIHPKAQQPQTPAWLEARMQAPWPSRPSAGEAPVRLRHPAPPPRRPSPAPVAHALPVGRAPYPRARAAFQLNDAMTKSGACAITLRTTTKDTSRGTNRRSPPQVANALRRARSRSTSDDQRKKIRPTRQDARRSQIGTRVYSVRNAPSPGHCPTASLTESPLKWMLLEVRTSAGLDGGHQRLPQGDLHLADAAGSVPGKRDAPCRPAQRATPDSS
ncbi:hypothetical protein EDD27_5475 [Nonomuraea polychroma]|uniref:Uncharacterized protein n=1 Tax=Nonomuraea polychroma TaxID=46176 RepID=A0A438MAP6_9ACTN|nr:hypothetical protein EDD27_5475 [Nonomuraea polychroma]